MSFDHAFVLNRAAEIAIDRAIAAVINIAFQGVMDTT
jgi:hypothetical protein